MRSALKSIRRQLSRSGRLIAIAACIAVPTTTFAQEAPPESPEAGSGAASGQIIYSRDVSYGSAIGPRAPGREHSVTAGPTDLIIASLASGLMPISDDENANIVSGPASYIGSLGQNVSLSMRTITNINNSGPGATNLGDVQSSAIGGVIGQVNGVMQNSMGNVRGVLGDLLGGGQ